MKISGSVYIDFGKILLFLSGMIMLFLFGPLLIKEVKYLLIPKGISWEVSDNGTFEQKQDERSVVLVKDSEFGLVIPEININASIISNVDSTRPNVYQKALTKGVAHGLGSSFPGEDGNVFLFSHSSLNLADAFYYNSVFYLLYKLTLGDLIYVYYKGVKYTYVVGSKEVVLASETDYLKKGDREVLTLMTCWPPGTNFKRLIIRANPI
ncbi:hypothetical protein A2382_00280 [Candidatus Woesebacteria bacterium RIFOXYB1_FULL_38_16]|uniref:Sortase n=1 Tax=Candidatus Woesebacteria bacterium RIFOXYB1_FULL_38_16 TaxID=1802538 RepID=A0A1F8CTZ4_9BACT|nr:MAG: hypothetical protein A2191_01195 [Candidatus Woesebacteria bacterium RIFOXYA1_FULL_38_9]OGM79208.1 MAG: hypothetical protein A2382_00280 [Candidatus Woesebacteria bacterium RIFOXYB1_FULL_38_16]